MDSFSEIESATVLLGHLAALADSPSRLEEPPAPGKLLLSSALSDGTNRGGSRWNTSPLDVTCIEDSAALKLAARPRGAASPEWATPPVDVVGVVARALDVSDKQR